MAVVIVETLWLGRKQIMLVLPRNCVNQHIADELHIVSTTKCCTWKYKHLRGSIHRKRTREINPDEYICTTFKFQGSDPAKLYWTYLSKAFISETRNILFKRDWLKNITIFNKLYRTCKDVPIIILPFQRLLLFVGICLTSPITANSKICYRTLWI